MVTSEEGKAMSEEVRPHPPRTRDYPEPTPEMLDDDPLFEAIWQAIKGWDISRHNDGLYSGPTGNDVRHIYDAVKPAADRIEALKSLLREVVNLIDGEAGPRDFFSWRRKVDNV